MNISPFISFRRRLCAAHLVLTLVLAVPAGLCAAEHPTRTYGEKTGEAFKKIGPLNEAQNWNGMLAVLDALAPTVEASSYDMALIMNMKGGIYGRMDQYAKAVEAWENALRIAEGKDFFDAKDINQMLLASAQFSYQEGSASKVPAVQQQYIGKAAGFFRRYMQTNTKPTPEIVMFYASILFGQAVVDPTKIDFNLLKQAKVEVERGLRLDNHPKDGLYALLLAIQQQENDFVHSAETLEFLVKQFPDKKAYWPSLWSTYYTMASEKDIDPKKSREYLIRSINTAERAQALGFMNTPKDNLYLANFYFIAGQYSKGTELLHAGLKKGTIENDVKNWMLLGYNYEQANRQDDAIAAYKEAAQRFPNDGTVDIHIAEIYRQRDLLTEARQFYRSALKKGGLEKPFLVLAFLAQAAFSMDDLDEAKTAIEEAEKYPAAKGDTYLPQLKKYVMAAIEERDAAKQPKKP